MLRNVVLFIALVLISLMAGRAFWVTLEGLRYLLFKRDIGN
jgi:hypothetical protein